LSRSSSACHIGIVKSCVAADLFNLLQFFLERDLVRREINERAVFAGESDQRNFVLRRKSINETSARASIIAPALSSASAAQIQQHQNVDR